MFLFIETIRIENGTIPMLWEHQQRINRTLAHIGLRHPFILKDLLVVPEEAQTGIYKCRIIYDKNGVLDIQFHTYSIKKIATLSLVDIGERTYAFKYEDRTWINDLLEQAKTDEIIMCQNDHITDSSYANLAFFNGTSWVTPKNPLLHGARRQQLLENKVLGEVDITIKDLKKYSHLKCINAMMTWEEAPILSISQINLS